jgi:very-short-patch-repair endonuclease
LWPYLTEHGLAVPETNTTLVLAEARLEVDFLWEQQRLVVETDGEGAHGTRSAFHRDRWRDQLLVASGHRVIRVTWDQLDAEVDAVLARIGRALVAAG